jgi:hypothetical protein
MIHRGAAFACAPRDHGDSGEHVFDAMGELGDKQTLLFLCLLCRRDIANKGGSPSPVPLVEASASQRQRQ